MKWADDSIDDGTSEISNEYHGLSSGDDVSLFQGYLVVKFGSLIFALINLIFPVLDCDSSSAINAPGI